MWDNGCSLTGTLGAAWPSSLIWLNNLERDSNSLLQIPHIDFLAWFSVSVSTLDVGCNSTGSIEFWLFNGSILTWSVLVTNESLLSFIFESSSSSFIFSSFSSSLLELFRLFLFCLRFFFCFFESL